jgi:protein-tyrosine phosphatase
VKTPAKILDLIGAHNFRDLGGYRTAAGSTTRFGRLFRSDTLHELTVSDVAILDQLGLRTIIDLRTEKEAARSGRGPLGDRPIDYVNVSVLVDGGSEEQAAPTPDGSDVAERYLWYLENGSTAFPTALGILSEPERYPVVFHCYAGKDRTGVLAALVLALLDVPRPTIVSDYALTAARMERLLGRLAADPRFAGRLGELPASAFSVDERSMEGFLEGLDQRYGGAKAWAREKGLQLDQLDMMASALLEPAPPTPA